MQVLKIKQTKFSKRAEYKLTLPTMGLLEQSQILGGHNVPPIVYACSIWDILMKLCEINTILVGLFRVY